MNDKEIRLKILNYLKKIYDEKPQHMVEKNHLFSALDLSEVEIERNVIYLEERGLINVQRFLGGGYLIKMNSRGIDMIEQMTENEDSEQQENGEGKNIKIFLSYSSLNYEIAKNIKTFLEDLGLEVFLAQASIEPTKEWEDEVYKNLRECTIFIPILTEEYKNSNWTDQEAGIAYNEKKTILPLYISKLPYGFLAKFQALRFDLSKLDSQKIEETKIIEAIMIDFKEDLRRIILSSLDKTYCWAIGKIKINLLKRMEPFNKEEINKIIDESSKNNQIYDAGDARLYLKKLIEEYDSSIEPSIKTKMMKILEPKK